MIKKFVLNQSHALLRANRVSTYSLYSRTGRSSAHKLLSSMFVPERGKCSRTGKGSVHEFRDQMFVDGVEKGQREQKRTKEDCCLHVRLCTNSKSVAPSAADGVL